MQTYVHFKNGIVSSYKYVRNRMFRIAWKSFLTGYEGSGEYCIDSKGVAYNIVKELNTKYGPDFNHWVEELVE